MAQLHEYKAKQILAEHGIEIPRGEVAFDEKKAREIAERLGGEVVIKVVGGGVRMQVRRLFHGASIAVLIVVAGGLVSGRQVSAGGFRRSPPLSDSTRPRLLGWPWEVRAGAKVELPPGLQLTLWAPQQLLIDPVAIDIDARGRAYVTSTTRKDLPADIRPHPDWTTTAHTLKTTISSGGSTSARWRFTGARSTPGSWT